MKYTHSALSAAIHAAVRIVLILCLTLFTIAIQINAQNLGVGVGYATSNSFDFEILLRRRAHFFNVGGTFQISDKRGKLVDNQLSNYGTTIDGKGEYFYTIDFGYGTILKSKWTLDGELSIGSNNYYTNYIDNRFNGGGYHMITKKESIAGVGLNAGYIIKNNWNVFIGFNSIRKLQFGIRIWI